MGRFEDSRYIRIELLYTWMVFFFFSLLIINYNYIKYITSLLALLVKYHLLTRIKFMYVCVRMNSKFFMPWRRNEKLLLCSKLDFAYIFL